MKIDGKEIAQKIVDDLKNQKKPDKILAVILVGSTHSTGSGQADSPQVAQSLSFIKQKEKTAQKLDIKFKLFQFDENISEQDLILEIEKLNNDEKIGGIILQLPLPEKFDRNKIVAVILPQKDIDALTEDGKKLVDPPPVGVIKDILKIMNYELENKVVAIVGQGFLVGKPVSEWLAGKCKEPILFNSKSDLLELKKADLVITGVGKAGLIKPEMLKNGAGVIDFGYGMKDGKLMGDFDPVRNRARAEARSEGPYGRAVSNGVDSQLGFYTPTPGGTGPILVAEIFKNFYKLNKNP